VESSRDGHGRQEAEGRRTDLSAGDAPLIRFERYVVLGDSTAEGLDDPDGRGGYRGWADRLAERLAAMRSQPPDGSPRPLLYANLALRGRQAAQVRAEQLEPALAMRPDLALVVAGTNDMLRPRFDADAVAGEVEAMQKALVQAGAMVVSFTLPDLGPVMRLARPLQPRIHAFARALREASARSGARLVDFTAHPMASDPRLWSEDRLHANASGHARIAEALADVLELPGADAAWQTPLPARPKPSVADAARAELRWARLYLWPWLLRHARGRSSGDGRVCKRPVLLPFEPVGPQPPPRPST
jgi:lysophospholipase L1-like esterase